MAQVTAISILTRWRSMTSAQTVRAIVFAAGAVAVALVLGMIVWFWSSVQQQRGTSTYATALLQAEMSRQPNAPVEARVAVVNELEAALAAYPSNVKAAEAAYELGNLRFQAGEHDRARSAWQIAIARSSSPTITTLARAGIGYSWEAERKYPEAVQAFESALAGLAPTSFYYEELLLALGRTQERSGKPDAATATYNRLLRELPNSPRADDVRTRLAKLGPPKK